MLRTIHGRISGLSDLLYSKYQKAPSGGKESEEAMRVRASQRYHCDEAGQLIIPAINFKRCILDGCTLSGAKYGRKALWPYVRATVFTQGDLGLGINEPDDVLEVMGRIPPKTGSYVPIWYPRVHAGWSAPFSLVVTDQRRDLNQLHEVVMEAGMLAGLGAWRPDFGRFEVTEWEVAA